MKIYLNLPLKDVSFFMRRGGGSVYFYFSLQDFWPPPPFLDPLKNVTPPPTCFTKHMRKQSVVLFLNTVCASVNNTQALAYISKSGS